MWIPSIWMDSVGLSNCSTSILGTQTNIQKGWVDRYYEEEESRGTVQENSEDARSTDKAGVDNF